MEPNEIEVRAWRRAGAILVALWACGSPGGPPSGLGPPAAAEGGAELDSTSSDSYVYRCEDDYRFTLRVQGDSIRLGRDEGTVTLARVPSPSGAKFGTDTLSFWSRGTEVLLRTPTRAYLRCHGERADSPWTVSRLLGNDFRAIGQEPGWLVEIDRDRRMHVLADYGEVEFHTPPPRLLSRQAGTSTYIAATETHTVTVTITEQRCADTMSGESFPSTVTLVLDGQPYDGCGRWLDD